MLPALAAFVVAWAHGGARGGVAGAFAVLAGVAYGALILSFLGGIWWSVACARLEGAGQRQLLVTAVLPSIVAGAILCVLPFNARAAGGLMGAAIVATLLGDRWLAGAGLVPGWWLALRMPLSTALGAAMVGIAWVA